MTIVATPTGRRRRKVCPTNKRKRKDRFRHTSHDAAVATTRSLHSSPWPGDFRLWALPLNIQITCNTLEFLSSGVTCTFFTPSNLAEGKILEQLRQIYLTSLIVMIYCANLFIKIFLSFQPTSAHTNTHTHTHTHTHTNCQREKASGTGKDASLEQIWRQM